MVTLFSTIMSSSSSIVVHIAPCFRSYYTLFMKIHHLKLCLLSKLNSFDQVLCNLVIEYLYPPQILFLYPPRKLCLWWVYCFHIVRPSITFCFLNILKSHRWIFIKPCKHVHICMTNTLDKKVRARGQFY